MAIPAAASAIEDVTKDLADRLVGAPEFDASGLLSLARDRSSEARSKLVAAVSDLYFQGPGTLSEQERELMSGIMRSLIQDVEMSVRRRLAERLADKTEAPRDLVVALANDDIEVAHPILVRSKLLLDEDLIEVIRFRTLEHQLATASREELSEAVSDALVETENVQVITTLLENENALISKRTLDYLVEQSRKVDNYQRPLLGRKDLDPDLAKRMYWWVSAALRKHIVTNYEIDPTELDDAMESTVKEVIDRDADEDRPSAPERLAAQLPEERIGDPKFLIKLLREGEISLFVATLAKFTGLKSDLVRRFMIEPGGERLAIATCAIGIDKSHYAQMFLLCRKTRPGDKQVEPDELSNALAFYDRLKPAVTREVLRRWRLDPDYLAAISDSEAPAA